MRLAKLFSLFLLGGLILFSCDKDLLNYDWNNAGGDEKQERKLIIRLTDEPIDADQVNVDIRSVMIKTNEGFDSVALETMAGVYNLLDYQNGVDTLIANTIIDFDNIKEIRLILGDDNSIMVDSVLYPLQIPSGQQSGLKIKVNIDVSNDELVEILIDFDALESVVAKGNGEYLLKPVIKVKEIIQNSMDDDGEDEEGEGEEGESEDEDADTEDGEEGEEAACTRGKGYWKTHSENGPAPYDEAWGALENGADTELFATGKTYMHFLSVPTGNNKYLKLAEQYVIAHLNVLSGAPIPEDAATAWDQAGTILETYAVTMIIDNVDQDLAKEATEILKSYNGGDLEVPSCDDDEEEGDDDEEDEEEGEAEDEESEDEEDEESEDEACTKGKGYWKTHSENGPAPYDEAWGALENGADTELFATGKSYMHFLTVPTGNNKYLKLAEQYVIAHLNVLAEVPIPAEAAEAWDQAGALLDTYGETMVIDSADEDLAKDLTELLKDYNSGDLGVPACED